MLFVAVNVPIVVSISAAAAAPIPVAAISVAVPVVTKLAFSAFVISLIAPVVAVTFSAPFVLVNRLKATSVVAM